MLSGLKNFFSRAKVDAATELPPLPEPKVRPGGKSWPTFFTSTKMASSALPKTVKRPANVDITTLRNGATDSRVVRDFTNGSPDLSAAVSAFLRTGITNGYTAIAKNPDGTCNRDGTVLVQQILARLNVLADYSEGFSQTLSIRSLSEQLAQEIMWEGAAALELVLDKARMPKKLQPVSVSSLEFLPDGQGLKPRQKVGSDYIDLDIPTFFYVALDQDLLEAYPRSPISTALRPVLFTEDLLNDVYRIIKRVVHPRQHVTIDEDKFRKSLSMEAQNNREVADAEMAKRIQDIANQVNNLSPEDALVYFDSLGFEVKDYPQANLANEYSTLRDIGNARLATGAKTLPAILGHGAASSNIASTETMLFVKNAAGIITFKLNELYSRSLTLAVRLFGIDCYVEFTFDDVNLRPETELEAFRQTRQQRILELLSLGFYTDDEAAVLLTGHLPPNGFSPLSGTHFTSNQTPPGNMYGGASNDGSALNKNIAPDTPTVGRGKNK